MTSSYYECPHFSSDYFSVVNAVIADIYSEKTCGIYPWNASPEVIPSPSSSQPPSVFFGYPVSDSQASSPAASTSSAPSPPHFPESITLPHHRIPKSNKSSRARRRSDPNHIPRPRNAFIIFRSAFLRAQKECMGTNHQNELSKQAGIVWRAMSPEEKEQYQEAAKMEQIMHRIDYPHYRYLSTRAVSKPKTKKTCVAESSTTPTEFGSVPEVVQSVDSMFAQPSVEQMKADTKSEYFSDLLPPSLQYDGFMTNAVLPVFPGDHQETFDYDYSSLQTLDTHILDSSYANVVGDLFMDYSLSSLDCDLDNFVSSFPT